MGQNLTKKIGVLDQEAPITSKKRRHRVNDIQADISKAAESKSKKRRLNMEHEKSNLITSQKGSIKVTKRQNAI